MLALAASAAAQNKISSTGQCGKAEKEYKINIGDWPGHYYEISQGKCTWKGDIAGIQDKQETYTAFSEISGDVGHEQFPSVVEMANGDRIYARGEGTMVLKNGVHQTEDINWRHIGGTGKFKGIKGNGTTRVKDADDGTSMVEAVGEYELPAAKN
jgi:hypothetical protein